MALRKLRVYWALKTVVLCAKYWLNFFCEVNFANFSKCFLTHSLIGWAIDWLIDLSSIYWLLDALIDWLLDPSMHWLIDCSIHPCIDWLIARSIDALIDWLLDPSMHWLIDCLRESHDILFPTTTLYINCNWTFSNGVFVLMYRSDAGLLCGEIAGSDIGLHDDGQSPGISHLQSGRGRDSSPSDVVLADCAGEACSDRWEGARVYHSRVRDHKHIT